ncbi:Helix-turn-helix domain-containing protein [Clostridium cavendishii DSM 21758]|uniref:Helix-turn-helix domain-containing protein n=1 Tax=Clostridium cavendishii DSM 21758 TaxID=1121302 RepID=A0A1M6CL21_9CLOT|nr:helix-turn-helix transcriptional regulator [Clostridium cavendishii]SHI61464.1 Helix-turn-helix domain-containing protein [Clostridium cavendishii DSM 21758]
MEILSTGEKIKRARIYKGITLKELCKDKISISKMSCIENDKIVPEQWILEIISETLDLDINYLIQNDEYQLHEYIKKAEKLEKRKLDVEELKYYIEYAESKEYYKEAFKLIHILVLVYMEHRDFASISNIFYKYYGAYEKNLELSKIFFEDISKYFFKTEQYREALMYLERLYIYLMEQNIIYDDINYYGNLKVFEGKCYYYLNNFEKLNMIIEEIKQIFPNVTDTKLEGKIYALSILLNPKILYEDRSKYNKMEECLKDNKVILAKVKFNIALSFFQFGDKDEALKEIDEALSAINKDNNEEYVEFLLKVIKTLIGNNEINKSKILCDEACDIAIELDNIRLVEKAYYFKGIVSRILGDFTQGEMYMNLSTDALMKFGNKKEKYDRYLEMANMYHVIGDLRDSLRYFTLAMRLEKIMNN